MIPRNTGYRLPGQMSAEFSAFRRQLPGGGYGAPADSLGPISALEELLSSARRGDINKGDGNSLEQDLRKALGDLGTRTKQCCSTEIAPLCPTLSNLRAQIRDPNANAKLQNEARQLLKRLEAGNVRGAAF